MIMLEHPKASQIFELPAVKITLSLFEIRKRYATTQPDHESAQRNQQQQAAQTEPQAATVDGLLLKNATVESRPLQNI